MRRVAKGGHRLCMGCEKAREGQQGVLRARQEGSGPVSEAGTA